MATSEKSLSILDIYPEQVMPEPNSGCWFWTSATDRNGYGTVTFLGKKWRAHRVAFLIAEGYVPPRPSYHHHRHRSRLVLDHLCRNPVCCNPDHLQVVTQAENVRRGEAGKNNREKTHCPYGHPYSGENLYVKPGTGGRECRECRREEKRRYHARRAERVGL